MSQTSETPVVADARTVAPPKVDNTEAIAKARDHGWVETSDLQYDAFITQPPWASDAQVYEFRGEEGEVGPVNEALEKQLFGTERTRAGDALKALELSVTQEGPTQIKPARNVSESIQLHLAHNADLLPV